MLARSFPKSPPLSFVIIGIIVTCLIIAIIRRECESRPFSIIKGIPFDDELRDHGGIVPETETHQEKEGEDMSSGGELDSPPNALNETAKEVEVRVTKSIITGHTKGENVVWMREAFVEPEYSLHVYSVDDPNSTDLHTPMNKGHEAMPYLTYILDNYDNLSDFNIFLHPHRTAWHTVDTLFPDTTELVQRLNLDHVRRVGYMNMRCKWVPGCPAHIDTGSVGAGNDMPEQAIFAGAWRALFGEEEKMPRLLGAACCSQFAVTREQIRAVPWARYETLRRWILDTHLDDGLSGRVFESLWQYVFLGRAVDCPSEERCYCDGYGLCFEGDHNFAQWAWVRERMDEIRGQVVRIEADLHDEEAKKGVDMEPLDRLQHERMIQKLRIDRQSSILEANRLKNVYEETFLQALESGKNQQLR